MHLLQSFLGVNVSPHNSTQLCPVVGGEAGDARIFRCQVVAAKSAKVKEQLLVKCGRTVCRPICDDVGSKLLGKNASGKVNSFLFNAVLDAKE